MIGNLVIAAAENDSVYALSARDGQVAWSVSLGQPMPGADLPCGDIDPLGITGTPAYDPDTGLVFVVAETADARHTLAGIASGRWCCAARSRLRKVWRSRTSNARR